MNQIDAWLSACAEHEGCRNWLRTLGRDNYFVPTRLLRFKRVGQKFRVRLVINCSTNGSVGETIDRYASLSHCWGDVEMPRLLKGNITQLRKSIPWQSLPQTFKDAITVACRLQISYMWIDALCIVQDDKDDWIREARSMVDVYSHAYVNITATASSNPSQGLFRTRSLAPFGPIVVRQTPYDNDGLLVTWDRWEEEVSDSPIAKRAWIVQEQFLAPRVLHFCTNQVYWQCQETLTSETQPVDIEYLSNGLVQKWLLTDPDLASLHRLWSQLVVSYSRTDITFETDRPFAIEGLAQLFTGLFTAVGDYTSQYYHGLWEATLAPDMLWHAYRPSSARNAVSRRCVGIPSWSWLSIYDAVNPGYETFPGFHLTNVLRFADVSWLVSSDQERMTRLKVVAPLCRIRLELAVNDAVLGYNAWREGYIFITDQGSATMEPRVYPDDPYGTEWTTALQGLVFLALIGSRGGQSLISGSEHKYLILQWQEQGRCFRRVGYAAIPFRGASDAVSALEDHPLYDFPRALCSATAEPPSMDFSTLSEHDSSLPIAANHECSTASPAARLYDKHMVDDDPKRSFRTSDERGARSTRFFRNGVMDSEYHSLFGRTTLKRPGSIRVIKDALRKHNIPQHICGPPNAEHMYTFTLA